VTYASICFLSYNRPEFLAEAVESAKRNAGFPCEVIVHDDGSDDRTWATVSRLLRSGEISRVVANPPGRNEGVGAAFNRAAAVATGDYLIKMDQDLLFQPNWLSKTVDVLEADPQIGAMGLFKYDVDPVDWRKMELDEPTAPQVACVPYHYVKDFVGSAIAMTRAVWDVFGPWPEHSDAFAEDVEFKLDTLVRDGGLRLALPDEDLAHNRGFGVGPSTVAVIRDGQLTASEINHGGVTF